MSDYAIDMILLYGVFIGGFIIGALIFAFFEKLIDQKKG